MEEVTAAVLSKSPTNPTQLVTGGRAKKQNVGLRCHRAAGRPSLQGGYGAADVSVLARR